MALFLVPITGTRETHIMKEASVVGEDLIIMYPTVTGSSEYIYLHVGSLDLF